MAGKVKRLPGTAGGAWTAEEDAIVADCWKQFQGPRRIERAHELLPHRTENAIAQRASTQDLSGNRAAYEAGRARVQAAREALVETITRTEIISGWRVWRAITNGRDAMLLSITTLTIWPAGAPLVAHDIRRWQTDGGKEPRTGIQAYKRPVPPAEYGYAIDKSKIPGEVLVHGRIALWGRVIEHVNGYRAEYAYPSRVLAPTDELARAIRRSYGIESFTAAPPEKKKAT